MTAAQDPPQHGARNTAPGAPPGPPPGPPSGPLLPGSPPGRASGRPSARGSDGAAPVPVPVPGASESAVLTVSAAVVREPGGPFVREELLLDARPRPDEVLVRVVASGVCQTDVHVRDRALPTPLPVVLGHEGAGVVERVGAAVRAVAPGDRVIMSYQSCGGCRSCLTGAPAYCFRSFPANFGGARLDRTNALRRPGAPGGARSGADTGAGDSERPGTGGFGGADGSGPGGFGGSGAPGGEEMHGHFFGQSSFATHALATERNVVKAPDDLPLELLAPLGCGLQTGAGAVLTSLRVPAGASLVVLGTGTVGLAAVMAAKVAGASPIIAVDIVPERLDLAADLGATHTLNAKDEDVAARIAEITHGGADYILEITARPDMLTLAVDALAPLGTAALIGGAPAGTHAEINMSALLGGRTLRGITQGDSVPQLFVPRLIALHRAGRFPFDRLITPYDFAEINEAVADMCGGGVIKPVLRIGE